MRARRGESSQMTLLASTERHHRAVVLRVLLFLMLLLVAPLCRKLYGSASVLSVARGALPFDQSLPALR